MNCKAKSSDDVRCTSVIDVVRVTVNEANPSSPPLSTKVDHGESKLGVELPESEVKESATSTNVDESDDKSIGKSKNNKTFLNDYISNSTIHGLRYFNDHHWLEKTWWILTFTAAASGCAFLILNIYHQWQDHPVHLAFGSKPVKLWQIPYPALTICPIRQFLMGQSILRKREIVDEHGNGTDDADFYNIIRATALPTNQFIDYCDVAGRLEPGCVGVFSEVITQHGLCYTYNSVSHADMFTDKVTPDFQNLLQHHLRLKNPEVDLALIEDETDLDSGRLTHPRRVLGSSDHKENRFTVRMKQPLCMPQLYCDAKSSGYYVIVHPPQEWPFHHVATKLPLDGSVRVVLDATVVAADPAIRNYLPEKRQCYFRNERKLEFFREYTSKNCESECLAYHALRDCKCVHFATPRAKNTPVCITFEQKSCWIDVMTNSVHGLLSLNKTWPCDCLPACDEISYSLVQRKIVGNLVWTPYHTLDAIFSFGRNEFEIQRRVQQFGRLGFLANCGGLLSLFMGVSFLSFAEFVYFFSVRMLCNLRRVED